jgi:hypothetical protein
MKRHTGVHAVILAILLSLYLSSGGPALGQGKGTPRPNYPSGFAPGTRVTLLEDHPTVPELKKGMSGTIICCDAWTPGSILVAGTCARRQWQEGFASPTSQGYVSGRRRGLIRRRSNWACLSARSVWCSRMWRVARIDDRRRQHVPLVSDMRPGRTLAAAHRHSGACATCSAAVASSGGPAGSATTSIIRSCRWTIGTIRSADRWCATSTTAIAWC